MKVKKQNGFTLVEVLAVIVILAIIMAIAVPIVTNQINSSRKKAFFASVNGLLDNLKPAAVLEGHDYCYYNYSKDSLNKTDNVKEMYVLAYKENNNIVYSVYAQGSNEEDLINTDNFKSLSMDKSDKWVSSDTEKTWTFIATRELVNASKYKQCGFKEVNNEE